LDQHGFRGGSASKVQDDYVSKKNANISWTQKPSTKEKHRFLTSTLIDHDAIGVYEKTKNRPV
jgi:hypothetical protein